MSDPVASDVIDDSQIYAALMSRLTNTDGRLMIEGPPRGPHGKFYELYEKFKDNKNPDFKVFLITIYDAQKEGLVTQEYIDKAKIELGPLYPQTYEGSFVAGVGNVMTSGTVDKCIALGERLKHIPISQYTMKIIGLDVGFSSSRTAMVFIERLKNPDRIIVRFTKEWERGDPNAICDELFEYYRNYWNLWICVDGSNRAMVNLLKIKWNEPLSWEPKDADPNNMKIVPVNFGTEHKNLLSNLHVLATKGYLAIPKEHEDLIASFRTAQADELNLLKDRTLHNDLFDSARLAAKGFSLE